MKGFTMDVRRLYGTVLNGKRFYRNRNFGLGLAGQTLVIVAALHFILQRGSLPGPAFLVTAGMVISGVRGSGMARARRARDRVQNLLTGPSDAYGRLQAFAEQSRQLAAANERNRLAREIHDTLGHRLTASIVQLEGANRLMELEPRRAAGMVETVRAQLGTGLEELRGTFQELRQSDHFDAAAAEAATGMESGES